MIKVLKKAFSIVEYVAGKSGNPVLPGEIVAALGINQPTCVRILKDLVELNYLEQISRQKGYVLGPLAYWITGTKRYREELVAVADPLVERWGAR